MEATNQLSFEEAKRLSIKKWEMIVEDLGNDDRAYGDIELRHLRSNCGFCERYSNPRTFKPNCSNCEFGAIVGNCYDDHDGLFRIWCDHPTKKNAEKILNAIKKLNET